MNIKHTILICLLCISFKGLADNLTIGKARFKAHSIQVGNGESAIASGDFNRDGHQDLAISSEKDAKVAIFLGSDRRQFTRIGQYGAGANPSDIIAADLNADGKLDLLIANHETHYLSLLLGKGNGEFAPAKGSPLTINVSPHPHIVRVTDMDGDNQVDILVDNRDALGLLLLKGRGDGSFITPGKVINTGGDPYLGFALGDINADGVVDIASPNANHVSIVLGTGTANQPFADPVKLPMKTPFAVELADINGDGKLDLIVASRSGGITVVDGQGNGNFDLQHKVEFALAPGAKRIAVGDINGDGISDALISNWHGEVGVLQGSKTSLKVTRFKPQQIQNPWMLHLADLNNDNKSDLMISNGSGKRVVVYMSGG